MLTDFGKSPTFYSCVVEVEKAAEKMRKQTLLEEWGGKEGYIQKWREDPRNQGMEATDEEIIQTAEEIHPGVFN